MLFLRNAVQNLRTFIIHLQAGLSRSEKRNWGSAAVERLLGRHKRTVLRRFVFFILVVMYVPVAVTGIHTYLCSNSVPAVYIVFSHYLKD